MNKTRSFSLAEAENRIIESLLSLGLTCGDDDGGAADDRLSVNVAL
jgi:hypothetical protein